MERLELLLLDGIRRLPEEEAQLLIELLTTAGAPGRPPKRVALAHRAVLDLQARVLPVPLRHLRRWVATRETQLP